MNKSVRIIASLLVVLSFMAVLVFQPTESLTAGDGYRVEVNVGANVVTAYYNDVPVRVMPCSTGSATPVSGTYPISNKYTWRALFGGVSGQYASRITGHILFHSVPYTGYGNPASLETDQFDLLGTPASMGCVRLMVGDAKWIYDNCPSGTPVSFYWDPQNPGPLGWPYRGSIAIFDQSFNRWDPTDPSVSNPWNEFLGVTFDADYYLANNPDLFANASSWNENTLRMHWLTVGIAEGRQASAEFNVNDFKAAHPELLAMFGDNNYRFVQYYNLNAANYEANVLGQAQALDTTLNTQVMDGSSNGSTAGGEASVQMTDDQAVTYDEFGRPIYDEQLPVLEGAFSSEQPEVSYIDLTQYGLSK